MAPRGRGGHEVRLKELEAVQRAILEIVATGSYRPSDVIRRLVEQHVDPLLAREALWRLIDVQKLDMTPDHRIRPGHFAVHSEASL